MDVFALPDTIRDAFVEVFQLATSSIWGLLALVAVLVAGVFLGWRTLRHKQLLKDLEKLPEKDRLRALRDEMGTVQIKGGLTPEQYLRSRIHMYVFALVIILSILFVGVIITARVLSSDRNGEGTIVEGTIVFEGDLQEVDGARVGIIGTQFVTRTDENGHFSFNGVPHGQHVLRLEYNGVVDTMDVNDQRMYFVPRLIPSESSHRLVEGGNWLEAESAGNCPVTDLRPKAGLYVVTANIPTDPDSYPELRGHEFERISRLVINIKPAQSDSITRVINSNPAISVMHRDPTKHAPSRELVIDSPSSRVSLEVKLGVCTASPERLGSQGPFTPLATYWLEAS